MPLTFHQTLSIPLSNLSSSNTCRHFMSWPSKRSISPFLRPSTTLHFTSLDYSSSTWWDSASWGPLIIHVIPMGKTVELLTVELPCSFNSCRFHRSDEFCCSLMWQRPTHGASPFYFLAIIVYCIPLLVLYLGLQSCCCYVNC